MALIFFYVRPSRCTPAPLLCEPGAALLFVGCAVRTAVLCICASYAQLRPRFAKTACEVVQGYRAILQPMPVSTAVCISIDPSI